MDPREKDRDEVYEVLGAGQPDDPAADRTAGLPALDLGERTNARDDLPGPPGRDPMPAWQRWAAIALSVVVGGCAGAYVWHARTESAEHAAGARAVELVAGQVSGSLQHDRFGLPQPPRRVFVELHNAGERDVRVRDVRLAGYQLSGDRDPSSTETVPAGEWLRFALMGEPACVGSVPDHVDVDVRTDGGDSSVVVPLPPDDALRLRLRDVYRLACPDIAPRTIVSEAINARRGPVDPERLQMGVQLLVPGPETEITALDASAAGFRGEGTDLPVTAGGGRRSVTVTIDWHLDSCADATGLSEVTLDVQLGGGGDTVPVALSSRAVAVLARFAAEECRE